MRTNMSVEDQEQTKDATPPLQSNDEDVSKRRQKAKDILIGYLNKRMRVFLSDGRVIIGNFLCTDRDSNLVLGNCEEYLSQDDLADVKVEGTQFPRQPRTVGLAIVPGEHIRNLSIAKDLSTETFHIEPTTSSTSGSPNISVEEPNNCDLSTTDDT